MEELSYYPEYLHTYKKKKRDRSLIARQKYGNEVKENQCWKEETELDVKNIFYFI